MKQMIRMLLAVIFLMAAGSLHVIYQLRDRIAELESREPIVLYHVDNAGGTMVGQVTAKEMIDGHPTVTVGAYGKFLVTKDQYDRIEIGDDVPEYLKGRDAE